MIILLLYCTVLCCTLINDTWYTTIYLITYYQYIVFGWFWLWYVLQCFCLLKVFWCACSGRDCLWRPPTLARVLNLEAHATSFKMNKLRFKCYGADFFFHLKKKFGPFKTVLTEIESPERENNSPVYPATIRSNCISSWIGEVNLSRLLHLGVTMPRRSSGGGDGIAVPLWTNVRVLVLKCFLIGVVYLLGWSM